MKRTLAASLAALLTLQVAAPAAGNDSPPAMTTKARLTLEGFGACIAHANPREAHRVLTMDFTSKTYSRALQMLAESAPTCATWDFRTLRSANLLFAGEVAEALIDSDTQPVGAHLARVAAAPAVHAYSLTDQLAICVVRSTPDQVSALFETERDSAAETAALEALQSPLARCAIAARVKQRLSISDAALRAMLATASYRSISEIG